LPTILTTRLYIPPPRLKAVLRPGLIERLNAGLNSRLTLISAPAGFGKTTLISQWVAACGRPVAWLSLDESDNDPLCFLTYLVAALQTIAPKIGNSVTVALQSPQPPPLESILTILLNEIASIPDHLVLVLDDYHILDAKQIDDALTFFIEHLPPRMHLVIATREDPPLPLSRLRVRGHLTELRAADLRFTTAEAAEFLTRVMGLNLSTQDIDALESRTEGWIAGLQLAALSMQGYQDTSGFIKSFTGSHHFVLDYLVEEVLKNQPENIRSFLLQTSILNRFNVSLCNAVSEREDGKEMLELLDRGNLFLIPLDDKHQWFRYHHLFGDVLQTHLMEAYTDRIAGLHRRASDWYERNNLRSDAVRHALAAEDFDRAAVLIELAWSAMDISYQSSQWLVWVKMLPDALVRSRPLLSLGYAWALLDGGELEASESRLHDAERWLSIPPDQTVIVDRELFRSFPASIATARAYHAMALGNILNTVKYAKQALELLPDDDRIRYIQATSLLGIAQYTSGDLAAAELSLSGFQTNLRKAGEILILIGITFLLGDIRVALGHLHDAESSFQQVIHLAIEQGDPPPIGTSDLYRGLSEIYIEKGDLEASAQYLLTGQKLGEQFALPNWLYRLNVSLARLKEARGDLDGAFALLDQAEHVYIRSPLPAIRPVASFKARIWLRQGKLGEAVRWAREQGLSVDDDIHFTREFEYITLARVLLAAGKNDRKSAYFAEAIRLLERLLQAAETSSRLGSAIQILLLRALAFQAQDDLPNASSSLKRALALAEPEGYIRVFVDEGEAMRLLIEKQSRDRHDPLSAFLDRLLAAFTQPVTALKSELIDQKQKLIEPLSERELEVLNLLRSELTGPEIARQLIVSLNTLRTHTKSIYTKLGVNNRRAAVRRAGELDLI
jgi:LuxR family transcriptional regulator, maltose regulon positive regulatory protein